MVLFLIFACRFDLFAFCTVFVVFPLCDFYTYVPAVLIVYSKIVTFLDHFWEALGVICVPCGLILGALGIMFGALGDIWEAWVGHLDSFWELWESFLEPWGKLLDPWVENYDFHENLVFPDGFFR